MSFENVTPPAGWARAKAGPRSDITHPVSNASSILKKANRALVMQPVRGCKGEANIGGQPASELRERSAPAKRRARERVRESEGRSASVNK
jgi:hypothetical protein